MSKKEKARKGEKKKAYMASGYSHHGANVIKKSLIGWDSSSFGPHDDIDKNLPKLRERSRDLYMGGSLIASGGLKTIRTNVIGGGLTVKPAIWWETLALDPSEADEWQRKVQEEFELWADSVDCDAARRNNFAELQQLAFISWLMNGDVFVTLPYITRPGQPYDLRVMLIEADRVCNPFDLPSGKEISQGVETGAHGEVVAFHICNQYPFGGAIGKELRKWERVEAFGKTTGRRNILHIMESERIGQGRGVPMLAPIIESAKQLGRYTDAELIAAVVSGLFTVFLSTQAPDIPPGQDLIPFGDQIDAEDPSTVELGAGAVVDLGPNGKVETANPGRPNAVFDSFVVAICRQIGSSLEIPYELLIKHFTASYSASRAALLEAWKMFRMRRSWFVSDFCQPIYEELITEGIAKGRIHAPGFWSDPLIRKAWLAAEWYGPTQGQLDPLKEVVAAKIRVEEGFSTRARETAELTGGDYEMNIRQREREEKIRRAAGLSQQPSTKTVFQDNGGKGGKDGEEE